MGKIISMIGTLLAGLGLSTIIPNDSLQPEVGTSAEDQANWSSILVVGSLVVGMFMWSMLGQKIKSIFK